MAGEVSGDVAISEIMQSLRRIIKSIQDYYQEVAENFGVTGPQLWALWEMGRSGPLALKDLASQMHLESSTVTGVVDRLVAKGLAERHPDARDRRRISLLPTDKGREILAAAPHPAQGHLLAGLASLEPARVTALHESLAILESVLQAEQVDAPFFFAKE